MKKCLTLLFFAISLQVVAQTYPITGINISLPANPDANTINWGSGTSMLSITATTKAENGRVTPHVVESKLLVTIKKGGAKICGIYTGNSAPASGFNTLTKVWNGTNAVALLGQDCVLTPGDYEICVQFFDYGPVGMAPLSEEKCKPFSIREKEQQTFQPPQSIAPVDGTVMSEADAKKPITFRWIPVIPRPQDPVTYRLTVWQLMQGQNGVQAMKANQPLITKDVDNIAQAVVNNLVSGPCLPPYLCSFIWNVQALNHEGKPIGENNGTSKPSQFSANSCDVNLTLKLKSVECLSTTNGNNNYKFCVSATYTSPNYNLTYSSTGSGFKAYHPSYSPFYTISLLTPALQVQNSGSATTVDYCFNVSVPAVQTAIKIGLQGDDKDPGPIVCQPGAELDIKLPVCPSTCDCGTWGPILINRVKYDCGGKMEWKCNQTINFSDTYQCSPNNESCQAKTKWEVTKDGGPTINSGNGASGSFTPTTNGTYTITLYASCNGKNCPTCTYAFVVSGCPVICECGTWGLLMVQNAAGSKRYECGSTIVWNCKVPFNFTDTYQCNPNNESCQAKTTWEIKNSVGTVIKSGTGTSTLSDGFSLTSNGTYTLTLNATCNGIVCKSCVYTVVVRDCQPTCECGKWIDLVVKIETGGAIISRVKCDGTATLGKGIYSFVSPGFACNPDNNTCTASYLWSVQGPVSGNGTGQTFSFNFTQAGTYTVTLTPICGGKKCPPCRIVIKIEDPLPCSLSFSGTLKDKYCVGDQVTINWTGTTPPNTVNLVLIDFTNWTVYQTIASGIPNSGSYTWTLPAGLPCDPERKWCFYVTDPSSTPQCWNYSSEFIIGCCHGIPCDCGSWGPILINRVKYDCGGKMEWKCNQPINFSDTYQCSPNNESCQAKTKWEVTRDGSAINSGSGTSGSFTPTSNGIYTVTLYANCNGKDCPTCTYTFVVQDCRCDCGTWGTLVVLQASGTKTYPCGIKMLIPGSCKQLFNFTDSYQCNPGNNPNCVANTTWKIEKGSIIINSGTGNNNLNGSFTPTENGIYTITLNATCNGKICDPCIYSVVVNDCCSPREIIIYKKKIPIPNDGSCIEPGTYNFVLTPTTPVVTGTYTLVSTPNNNTISTGPFNSSVPLTLTIPPYICGAVTGFKLTYSWNDGKCTSTIERLICVPPCCDNISIGRTNMSLTDTYLNFTTEFLVSLPETFTKVKVQILEVSVSGVARPNANILSINKSPAIPAWPPGNIGDTNTAITTPGNAFWFSGPLSAIGTLTFNGIIINILPPATTNSVKLILRYTFYKNNGNCPAVICEKDVTYYIGNGPRNPIK